MELKIKIIDHLDYYSRFLDTSKIFTVTRECYSCFSYVFGWDSIETLKSYEIEESVIIIAQQDCKIINLTKIQKLMLEMGYEIF